MLAVIFVMCSESCGGGVSDAATAVPGGSEETGAAVTDGSFYLVSSVDGCLM